MQYLITFLEGVISFLSPCMLPMLPLYLSYISGGAEKKQLIFFRSLFFVLGFTTVFSLLGLFAGSLGALLSRYHTVVNVVCGILVILFGLSYLEVIPLPFLKGMKSAKKAGSMFSAFLFGMIYSVSLTPCVGAFLGSALMMASVSGTALMGVTLLIVYSAGLGIPFLLSAVLIGQLQGTFSAIQKHYKLINRICGIFLIIVGIFMAFGLLNRLVALIS